MSTSFSLSFSLSFVLFRFVPLWLLDGSFFFCKTLYFLSSFPYTLCFVEMADCLFDCLFKKLLHSLTMQTVGRRLNRFKTNHFLIYRFTKKNSRHIAIQCNNINISRQHSATQHTYVHAHWCIQQKKLCVACCGSLFVYLSICLLNESAWNNFRGQYNLTWQFICSFHFEIFVIITLFHIHNTEHTELFFHQNKTKKSLNPEWDSFRFIFF